MRARSSAVAAVAAIVALAPLSLACGRKAPPAAAAPPTVSVVEVQPERVALTTEWVATLDGYVNAQIRPQVTGYLVRAPYREGGPVKKGDVLFEIDSRPLDSALAQAEGDLAEKVADLGRAEQDVERDRPLAEQRAIPQSQFQNDVQAHLAAKAAVDSAEAKVSSARLDREFTRVRSLIDGVAAIATAQIGDLVGPATLLTTVSQLDPIRAYFSLSEQEYLLLTKRVAAGGEESSPWKAAGALHLTLADGSAYPLAGGFVAADREIDPRTGTIRMSATFPNPDRLLRPGQYGRVRAETEVVEAALLVPQRAVAELQGGAQLRVVGADDKVHVVPVKLGSRVGQRWVVREGLEAGARVVVDAPSVGEGAAVTAQPWDPGAAAAASAAPAPAAAAGKGN